MKTIILIGLFLVSSGASAANLIIERNYVMPTLVAAVLVADYAQTLESSPASHSLPPGGVVTYAEKNPILGPHPSALAITAYFATVGALYGVGYATLPPWAGNALSAGIVIVEIPVLRSNWQLGYRFGF